MCFSQFAIGIIGRRVMHVHAFHDFAKWILHLLRLTNICFVRPILVGVIAFRMREIVFQFMAEACIQKYFSLTEVKTHLL
jgi:hypothetical protein